MEGQTVGPVQARSDDFRLAPPVPVDDGVDLVEKAIRDEHGPLVAEPQRACIRDSAGEDLDLETLGQLELRDRQLVFRGRNRGRRDAAQHSIDFGIGNVGPSGHGGGLRLQGGHRFRRLGFHLGWRGLRRLASCRLHDGGQHDEKRREGSGEHEAL